MQKVLVKESGDLDASPDSQTFSCVTLNKSYYSSEHQFPCLYDGIQDTSSWNIYMKETDKAA